MNHAYESYLGYSKNNGVQNSHLVVQLTLLDNIRQRMKSPYYPLENKINSADSLPLRQTRKIQFVQVTIDELYQTVLQF